MTTVTATVDALRHMNGTRTKSIIAKGFTTEDTEALCSALMFDYLAQTLNSDDVAILQSLMNQTMKASELALRREEAALKKTR